MTNSTQLDNLSNPALDCFANTRNDRVDNLHKLLKNNNADYFIYADGKSLKSAVEGAAHYGITLRETTPTLILKTKDGYLAVVICGDTRISFKKLKQVLSVKEISLADPQTVLSITGAHIGEISLINSNLETLIDARVLKNDYCYGGCGAPQSTLKIKTADLIRVTKARIIDFTDIK